MASNKLNFLYNKRKDVPLLRGRIYFIHLLMIPYFYYRLANSNSDQLFRLTSFVYIVGLTAHSLSCLVFHASAGYMFSRSALRRLDYGAIFLMNITNSLPVFIHLVETDLHVVILVFHLIVNFGGLFACLVMNFIFTNKEWRIGLIWISHICTNFVPYKFYTHKMYLPLLYYIVAYSLAGCGIFIYYLEKPNFMRGTFEYHELSHLFYTISSIFIFLFIEQGTGVPRAKIAHSV